VDGKPEAERREVLARLIPSEDDRQRIAAAIHDDSVQAITAAGMRLELLRRTVSDPRQLGLLDALERTIQLSIAGLRHLVFELLPPTLEVDGLAGALRMYINEAGNDTDVHYRLEDELNSEPPPETRLTVYRIAQEALTNIRKHAHASSAEIRLDHFEGGCRVRVSDDGVGFACEQPAPAARHLGVAVMQARAELAGGWLRIDGVASVGTTVEFWIPVAETGTVGLGLSALTIAA
jgi:signal transduction histidine kinase